MSNIRIIDTGWLSAARTGTQATRANSGTAIDLKTYTIDRNGQQLGDDTPSPSTLSNTQIPVVSVDNPTYTISLILDRTVSADYTLVKPLVDMEATKGIKLLYVTNVTDGRKTVVELIGAKNTGVSAFSGNEVGSTIPHLIGRVRRVRITDDAQNQKIRVTIEFSESG